MKIIALDVATTVGICAGETGAAPRVWSISLGDAPEGRKMVAGEKSDLDSKRYSEALIMTHGLIQHHKPDLIVVEAAIGGPKTSHYLVGLVACVRGCAFNNGVKVAPASLSTVRKHFLGKALTTGHFPHLRGTAAKKKAIKQAVMDRCAMIGWPVDTDDEADAVAIWDWACATWGPGYQSRPLGGLFNGSSK